MNKFHFRLEPVLRLRKHARDECRLQLATALEREAGLSRGLARVTNELSVERRSSARLGAIDLATLHDAQRYVASLEAQRHAVEQQRVGAARDVERRQAELSEAERDVRQLETLRQKQADRSHAVGEAAAARELDEIALFGRRA